MINSRIFLILKIFNSYITKIKLVENDNFYFFCKKKKFYILNYLLKNSMLFQINSLLDIVCIDFYFKLNNRFQLNYNLLSYFYNYRIFLVLLVKITLKNPYGKDIISLCNVYNSANWLEREVWDLFGVFFYNHKDLRRILSDYGFFGFSFRKDFPLMGYKELRYDEVNKIIVSENVNLTQEFRVFTFLNSWH